VRLTGKVAVVNGAAQGIGAAIATRLASEGATVTIGDVNSNGAKQVAADLSTDERQALGQMLDASNLASVRTMVNAVREQLGPIDIRSTTPASAGSSRFSIASPARGTACLRSTCGAPSPCATR
jgi:NAD(P)-dependent dehydrogenase (short-subunit alcohol dehydrogenase family)